MNTTLAPVAPPAAEYFSAADIARALSTPDSRVNKKFVQRAAAREAWPSRRNGNRIEYQPPQKILDFLVATPARQIATPTITVKFADLVASDAQQQVVLLREKAVKLLEQNLSLGKETALQVVCSHLAAEHPLLRCSPTSLRRWADLYEQFGIDGLVEQKRGRVGRKSFARDLDEQTVLKARAAAIEHGIKGRLNIARAYREQIVANPTVDNYHVRSWAHGDHASKTYVPPSVRTALTTPELATRFIQIGPKAAKLDGPYTECSYDNLQAGQAFTADDMTANVYVWTEWENEQRFLLIRPQILAVMDVRTMRWLNFRAIMRPKGQYNKDDVWGLIGDYLDGYGLHTNAAGVVDTIAVLEGGTWQSNVVIGEKTGANDEQRFGGLKALGVKVIHTRTPRGKIIEGAFNTLQHAADNCKGFCGRMEMKDCPEAVKQQLALVKAGHAHPRQYFMHISEYTAHLAGVMHALNHERMDGKLHHGATPEEVWAEHQPNFAAFPDSSKWLYRAAYRLAPVTRNGVTFSVGTGRSRIPYTYTHPALETWRGSRVVIFWNDSNPDTDAPVYTVRAGKPHTLICVASRLKAIDRFGANDAAMKAEATRKSLSAQLSVTHSRTLAPYLQRRASGVAPEVLNGSAGETPGSTIARAREAQAEKESRRARVARTVNTAAREITPADTEAALETVREEEPRREEFSPAEIADIFKTD